tara:strand:+ start:4205 stop:4627 length:423 start_codon:yes stop_codon:yes gene_type:complete
MNSLIFFFAPILGFLCAGIIKFLINSYKTKGYAFSEIGLGGFPSTHNTIVSSTYFTISLAKGFDSIESSIALALCLVVSIDSLDLRKKIEQQSEIISKLTNEGKMLRKKIGHSFSEVLAGYFLGFLIALFLNYQTIIPSL